MFCSEGIGQSSNRGSRVCLHSVLLGSCVASTLFLASASPRRSALLRDAGYTPRVSPVHIDEAPRSGELPGPYVARMAREKLEASLHEHVAWEDRPAAYFLAADTVVVRDAVILGKPMDDAEGERMLRSLSGRAHRVMTAFAVGALGVGAPRMGVLHEQTVTSRVRFREISSDEVRTYVATGEGRDKAGGYAIQGGAKPFVESLEGPYDNVVGLPVDAVTEALLRAGFVR